MTLLSFDIFNYRYWKFIYVPALWFYCTRHWKHRFPLCKVGNKIKSKTGGCESENGSKFNHCTQPFTDRKIESTDE